MAFCFKNTRKAIIMTEKDEKRFRDNNNCRFCGQNIESDKVGDHCHLIGKYRSPAHDETNDNVKKKQSNSIQFANLHFSVSVIVIVIQFLKG